MSSRPEQEKQKTLKGGRQPEEAVKPQGTTGVLSSGSARGGEPSGGGQTTDLMELVVSRENMIKALRQVRRNAGAPGVDGMTVNDLEGWLAAKGATVRESWMAGSYEPLPVRRVEIPKPSGGKREPGIPTVLDRLIQQALQQVLTPIFDPMFSGFSYGLRPGRKAWDAVRKAREYAEAGYEWIVDLDREDFFNRVNHGILMAKVAKRLDDKRVLKLIRRYLEAGVMAGGLVGERTEGTPQGGQLSPLLSNMLLDDLDKELERRGHRFTRYADDANVYVRSRRAGERVLAGLRGYLEKRLRLKVNEAKSAVDRPGRRKILGFSLFKTAGRYKIRPATQTIKRFKARLRVLTNRNRSQNLAERIRAVNEYLQGWLGYFRIMETPSILKELDGWIRHRLRAVVWKQWNRVRTRYRELRNLGLPEWVVHQFANSRKGPWRMAHGPLNRALGTAYRRTQGLKSLTELYAGSVNLGEPPCTERYARWCEGTGVIHPLLLDSFTVKLPSQPSRTSSEMIVKNAAALRLAHFVLSHSPLLQKRRER